MMMMPVPVSPQDKAPEKRAEDQGPQPSKTGNRQGFQRVNEQRFELGDVGVNVLLLVYGPPVHELGRKTQALVLPRVRQRNSQKQ